MHGNLIQGWIEKQPSENCTDFSFAFKAVLKKIFLFIQQCKTDIFYDRFLNAKALHLQE